jgi:hypothetical protein
MENRTAIDWLQMQLKENMLTSAKELDKLFEQAKEMEKQQIIDSYKQGQIDSIPIRETDAEQYFNLIFNQPLNKSK